MSCKAGLECVDACVKTAVAQGKMMLHARGTCRMTCEGQLRKISQAAWIKCDDCAVNCEASCANSANAGACLAECGMAQCAAVEATCLADK